jgi:hypothetical protein
MWRVLSFKTIISQNLKDTPLSLSVHPQLSVIPRQTEAKIGELKDPDKQGTLVGNQFTKIVYYREWSLEFDYG